MTFTFDPSLPTDIDLVRFHIGDTNATDGHYLENETINYFVTNEGVNNAVILCIKYIITQLSTPNFVQDWLEVDVEKARKGYENLLKIKADELDIALSTLTATSTVKNPTRADSYQSSDDADAYTGAP